MAYLTAIDTSTLANQNISSALLVHTYTNTTRVRKVFVNVDLDQVAGSGDYYAYITVQRSGAGSFYESIRTTKTAAAAITSITFGSIALVLGATDVMRVYVIGLAGDIATPDITTTVYEEWISTDASGGVGVATIANNAITAAAIANGAIDAATFVAGAIDATAIADGAIDAATFAAGAINAAAIATDAIDADALATDAADEIADHVWDELIAGHVGAGSTGATLNATIPGAPIVLNSEITEVHVT